jgi:hypothetical protein
VAASGLDGVRKIAIELCPTDGPAIPYTVALHFVQPEPIGAGERVFDVFLQGSLVAGGLDIVGQAGAARRALVRTWTGIAVRRQLEITFVPKPGSKLPRAAVSGVRVQVEQ